MNRKERNLQSFREALSVLQRQVDDLDELKVSHYHEIIEHEEEVWNVVQSKVCVAVRSTMDVFDKFTAKASDPVIEPMLQSVPDPFDSYGPPQAEDQIFSILAPLSIMTSAPSSSPSPMTGTPEREPMTGLPSSMSKITSWLPNTINGNPYPPESSEWATPSTPPRSASPPAINRRHSVPPGQRKSSESKLRSVSRVNTTAHRHHQVTATGYKSRFGVGFHIWTITLREWSGRRHNTSTFITFLVTFSTPRLGPRPCVGMPRFR